MRYVTTLIAPGPGRPDKHAISMNEKMKALGTVTKSKDKCLRVASASLIHLTLPMLGLLSFKAQGRKYF